MKRGASRQEERREWKIGEEGTESENKGGTLCREAE